MSRPGRCCPAPINDELMAAPRTTHHLPYQAGVPVPAWWKRRSSTANGHFLPADGESQASWCCAHAVADRGLQRAAKGRRAVGRWLDAHRRRGDPDAFGVIDIRDRIKDVIKTGGEWVSSRPSRRPWSAAIPAVREVAVVASPTRSGASARLPCWWCVMVAPVNWEHAMIQNQHVPEIHPVSMPFAVPIRATTVRSSHPLIFCSMLYRGFVDLPGFAILAASAFVDVAKRVVADRSVMQITL